MRFAKLFVAVLAVAGVLALAGQASAFTAPTNITPYLAVNNGATVTPITSTVPNVLQFHTSYGTTLSLPAGTSAAKAQQIAMRNLAWSKFVLATLTPAQRLNPLQVQIAMVWFEQNIGKPQYGV
jgi:hypothetical protein